MKKSFKFKIVSLALCAISCLVLAMATFTKTVKSVHAENVTITEMHTLKGFKILEKASVRRDTPVGLRFTTTVDDETQAKIEEYLGDGEIVYGTLIIPTDFLGSDELTHDTPSVVVANVNEWLSDTSYTAVLGGKGKADLGESYYNRPISARSFALNKNTGVVYYTENTACRSIGYVAYKAANDVDKPDASTVVVNIANNTDIDFTFNEYVSIHNEEESGMELIVNKYEQQSANVFALKIGGIIDEDAVINYTTSNSNVIDVVGNSLKAVGEGTATITGSTTVGELVCSYTKEISTDQFVPKTEYKILVAKNAGYYEKQGALKLQSVLKEATGVELKIVTETGKETTEERFISVGGTELGKNNCAIDDLTKDTASRVVNVGNSVIVRGKTEVATLYGVQQLLGDAVGYEYYNENCYSVNEKTEIVIKDKDYVPAIEFEVSQTEGYGDALASEHGVFSYIDGVIPIGADNYEGVAHNSSLLFAEELSDRGYYSTSNKSYKKWFATDGGTFIESYVSEELCYTAHGDSAQRNLMIERIGNEMVRKMALDEYANFNKLGFSHRDIQDWCQCSYCKKEGNPSDNMLHFVLDLAKYVKDNLPANDARKETFKICTLVYNETNNFLKDNGSAYSDAITNYIKHVEIWFANTRAEYNVPLDKDLQSNQGDKVYDNFMAWTNFAKDKTDVLWWGYYANARCRFIPFDSFDALRQNYALATDQGVDTMFNQSLAYKENWARLRYYLMSELRWNAKPTDEEWNGWIANYMKGAFGQGAEAMSAYFSKWNAWADDNYQNFQNKETGKGYGASSIYKLLSAVCTTDNMPFETLESWLNDCNMALAALDVNDKNYKAYRENVLRERLTPLYLIMHLYGYNYSIKTGSSNPHQGITSYTVKNSIYITPYAQDFLDGLELFNITNDGEMTSISVFKTALENVVSNISDYKDDERQIVVAGTGTSITVKNVNIASGDTYTSATLTSGAGILTAKSVTVNNNGSATLTFDSAPAVGVSYDVVLRSSTKVIALSDVFVITAQISSASELSSALSSDSRDGYFLLTGDIDATGITIGGTGRNVFKGTLDGNGHVVSNLTSGANGMCLKVTGATFKDVTFNNLSYDGSYIFAKTANSDATFKNVTISVNGKIIPLINGTEKKINVKITSFVPSVNTGKTFFVADGQSDVWIKDENIAKGKYQVEVNGQISEYTSFTTGRLKIVLGKIPAGETIKVYCSNGTSNFVYDVYCVAKITEENVNGDALDVFDGNESTIGFANGTYVQYTKTETVRAIWEDESDPDKNKEPTSGKTREERSAVIVMPEDKDWVSVDISLSANVGTAELFHPWGTVDGKLTAFGSFGATTDTTSGGVQVQFIDKYGFRVSSLSANTVYTMQLKKEGTEFFKLANVVIEGMTVYFGNVTYGEGDLPTPRPALFDGASYYDGDEVALGFAEGSEVYKYTGSGLVSFGVDSTYDYADVQIVIESGNGYLWMYGYNGGTQQNSYIIDPSWLREGNGTIPTDRNIEIYDENGKGYTTGHFKLNTLYTIRVYIKLGELDKIAIENSGSIMYFANVSFGNDEVIPEDVILVTDDSGKHLTLDKESSTALESNYVFKAEMSNGYNDGANVSADPTVYDYVDVQFVNASDTTWWFNVWLWDANGIISGHYFLGEQLLSNDTAHATYGDGYAKYNGSGAGKTKIQVLDANGNVLTGGRTKGTVYTLRVYICDEKVTNVRIGQNNVTMYFANVAYGNIPVEYPIKQGDGFLPVYEGSATDLGFGSDALVQYMTTETVTDAWGTEPNSGKTREQLAAYIPGEVGKYVTIKFVTSEDISGSVFYVWCMLGSKHVSGANGGLNFTTTTYGRILDVDGFDVSSIAKNTVYVLELYCAGTDTYKLANLCKTGMEMYFDANSITYADESFSVLTNANDPVQPDSGNKKAITIYKGDESEIGFENGTRVYKYVGVDSSKDKIHIKVDPTTYDYVDFQIVFDKDSEKSSLLCFAMSGSSWLNNVGYYNLSPENIKLSNGEMDRVIKVFDANGNEVKTAFEKQTLYTVRIYIKAGNLTELVMRNTATVYIANVVQGNDAGKPIEKPEELVYMGETKEEMPMYAENNADIGFNDDDYVFEHITRAPVTEGGNTTYYQWGDRAHIGNDSDATFLVFEFSMPNPANMTIWFTRNNNVVAGFSNVFGTNGAVWKNESDARTIFALDSNNVKVTTINANTKYTLWVYLNGADDFDGIAIGGSSSGTTIYYANVRYMYGTGDNVILQGESNSLLSEYTGNVADLGFDAGTFVQTLVGTSNSWVEDVYSKRARITADGTQTYIAVDFIVKDAITGDFLFKIWSPNSTFDVKSGGDCTYYKAKVIDQDGWVVTTIEPGVKYTLIVQDAGATYLAIGAYCNNTIYFGHVTYGYEDPVIYAMLKDGNGVLATYDGDESAIGFTNGELVQVWSTQPTGNWSTDAESKGFRLYGDGNSYTSINFSLESDLVLTDLFMFGWGHHDTGYTSNNSYILGANAIDTNARLFDKNCNLISSGTLTAKTVYTLEVYFPEGTVWFNVGNIGSTARTVYFATNSVKTYKTSIADSAIKGSSDGTVTLYQGTEDLGFGRNEVVKRLDTETVSDVWNDVQSTSGKGRSSWVAKIAPSAGKVAKMRFALSKDFNSTGTLFYVWAYSDNSGACPKNGSVNLSGTGSFTGTTSFARIVDEDGNAVTEIKANRVYVLEVYCDTAIKYDVGNFVAEGMTTYFGDVTYEDYVA